MTEYKGNQPGDASKASPTGDEAADARTNDAREQARSDEQNRQHDEDRREKGKNAEMVDHKTDEDAYTKADLNPNPNPNANRKQLNDSPVGGTGGSQRPVAERPPGQGPERGPKPHDPEVPIKA